MNKTIAVVTSSRADYGHLYWPLKQLNARPDIDCRLIVMASHLSPEYGNTIDTIEKDGFAVEASIECLLSSDSDIGMAKTIGIASMGLADVLGNLRPDLLLLIADRYEMLAPASVALALRIPIAHIEGGEISEGAIDDAVRNALTKLSHVHLAPTEEAAQRIIAMGEESWRVHVTGAPSLDRLRHADLMSLSKLETSLNKSLQKNAGDALVIASFHPVTMKEDVNSELQAYLDALATHRGPLVFCYPNADAGSRNFIKQIQAFCEQRGNADVYVNLDQITYWSLLSEADLFIGNSSSGIMETPSLSLPCVNIGIRQKGRTRAANIIDVPAQADQIIAAMQQGLAPSFRKTLAGMTNPYGDGHASEKISAILGDLVIDERLLIKSHA